MTDQTTADALPPDTTDDDVAKLRAMLRQAHAEDVNPSFEVPPSFAEQGYEPLPRGGGLFAIRRDHLIYKPMRAWDAAQKFADELVEVTGGAIYVLTHGVLEDLRGVAALTPDEGQSRADFELEVGSTLLRLQRQRWHAFLAACPRLQPYAYARRVIEACKVRRLPHPDEADKPEAERDPGGDIFKATGPGAVEVHYRGRQEQILRIGIAAAWGSVGGFFAGG